MIDLMEELTRMLEKAEDQFGPRDQSYQVLPPEFHAYGPQVFYPSEEEILIKLSFHCSHDPIRTTYQLAHETIHLLSPVPIGWATYLEEGLATYFAYQLVCENFADHGDLDYSDSGDKWLNQAGELATRLLAERPDGIKEMREEEFVISKFEPALIQRFYPDLSDSDAEMLTKHFQPWRLEQQKREVTETQDEQSADD